MICFACSMRAVGVAGVHLVGANAVAERVEHVARDDAP